MQQMPYDPTREQDRDGNAVLAIVLHEVNEPVSYIDATMQQVAAFPSAAHQSFHFAIDANGIHAYMPVSMAALAIAYTDTMTPWSIALANPGIDADLYTVNIAVSIGTLTPMPDPCTPGCGRTYSPALQHNLQVLLNDLATELNLDITATDVVWKHGMELCDLDTDPLILPLPVVTPGQEDWFCDTLAKMPTGDAEAPVLVGTDCKAYPMPTPLCDTLAALPAGTSESPLLVGTDCATYTAEQIVTAGGGGGSVGSGIVYIGQINNEGSPIDGSIITTMYTSIAGQAPVFGSFATYVDGTAGNARLALFIGNNQWRVWIYDGTVV